MKDIMTNQRAQQVLKILVARYIEDGCPVGSKKLAAESALGLSPATIRNILAELEMGGYLISPHTSAGRIPTPLGYRFFVNTSLTIKPLQSTEVQTLQSQLDPNMNTDHLLQSASMLLSNLTQLTGIVSLPKRNRIVLRQVEFLALSGKRVLIILVLNNSEVQNRIIHTDKEYSQADLQRAANFINAHYTGKDLVRARKELFSAMQEDRNSLTQLLQIIADKAFVSDENKDYVIAGQNNILTYTKEGNLDQLRALFDAFTQKQDILHLLDNALQAKGVQIFIGKESGFDVLDECSVVTSSYSVDGQLVGSLGVIGPVRMPYEKVISAVDVTAKLLSAALNRD